LFPGGEVTNLSTIGDPQDVVNLIASDVFDGTNHLIRYDAGDLLEACGILPGEPNNLIAICQSAYSEMRNDEAKEYLEDMGKTSDTGGNLKLTAKELDQVRQLDAEDKMGRGQISIENHYALTASDGRKIYFVSDHSEDGGLCLGVLGPRKEAPAFVDGWDGLSLNEWTKL
jgi:hypothetical protein